MLKNHFSFSAFKTGKALALFSMISFSPLGNASSLELQQAISNSQYNAVAKALESTSSINQPYENGDTPLLAAARIGDLKIMQLLVDKGANINQLDRRKRDILNIAISQRNPHMVRWALKNKIDPTMVTSVYQGSALIYACHQAQVEIVDMLIKAGAPLNRVNNLGWTALLETTILGDGSKPYQEIAHLLVSAGADASIADRSGDTPLDHAKSRGHSEIVKILSGN